MGITKGQLLAGKYRVERAMSGLRSTRTRFASCAVIIALSLQASSAAAAPTKDQCVDADTRAQDLRRDGKLLSTREALKVCVQQSCPRVVREDCTERLDELARVVPSIIFAAKDGAGHDLSAVAVTIDGKPFADHLDGSALELDPGEHSFNFTSGMLPPVILTLVIREAERARHEAIVIGPPPAKPTLPERKPAQPVQTPNDASSSSEQGSPGSAQRAVAWTALGLGAAGIVVGSVFGLESKAKHDEAKSCSATCPDVPSHNANEDALKFGNISTVAFIVGAVGVAGGLTLWLTAKPAEASPSASLGVGLGAVQFRSTF